MNQNPQSINVITLPSTSGSTPSAFAAPKDYQWVSRKQRATQFGDEKTMPAGDKPEWGKVQEELLPEAVQAFLDKHVIKILGQDEIGQAFLKELKSKANSFTKEEIPDEPTLKP